MDYRTPRTFERKRAERVATAAPAASAERFLSALDSMQAVADAGSAPYWSLPLADERTELRHGKPGEWQRPGNRMVHTYKFVNGKRVVRTVGAFLALCLMPNGLGTRLLWGHREESTLLSKTIGGPAHDGA